MIPIEQASGIMSLVDGAIRIVKYINDSKNIMDKAQLQYKLAEVLEILSNVNIEVIELKEKIRELEEQLKDKTSITRDEIDGMYYSNADVNKRSPYCPWCWENDKKKIHPEKQYDNTWYCKICNKSSGIYISELADKHNEEIIKKALDVGTNYGYN